MLGAVGGQVYRRIEAKHGAGIGINSPRDRRFTKRRWMDTIGKISRVEEAANVANHFQTSRMMMMMMTVRATAIRRRSRSGGLVVSKREIPATPYNI